MKKSCLCLQFLCQKPYMGQWHGFLPKKNIVFPCIYKVLQNPKRKNFIPHKEKCGTKTVLSPFLGKTDFEMHKKF